MFEFTPWLGVPKYSTSVTVSNIWFVSSDDLDDLNDVVRPFCGESKYFT